MNFPAAFLVSATSFSYGISSIGDKYLVTYRYSYSLNDDRAYNGMRALICSNPTDITGSIIEIIPYLIITP